MIEDVIGCKFQATGQVGGSGPQMVQHRKSGALWLVIIGVWSPTMVALIWCAIPSLIGSGGAQFAAVCILLIWLAFAWLRCVHQAVGFGYSIFSHPCALPSALPEGPLPRIAILYTVKDDFVERALKTCLLQDYVHSDVFVLDDSKTARCRDLIDEFCRNTSQPVRIIRRRAMTGHKAGNLNNALRQIRDTYEYFAVTDSDGFLPPDFLTRCLAALMACSAAGFVQARQSVIMLGSESSLSRDMAALVTVYWNQVARIANRFGFVMFHGHGALIRTKAWDEIGGFPEIVAEDLGFSTLIRERGYVGLIAEEVSCGESYPSDAERIARRELKYVRGTAEHLKMHMRSFLLSREVPWFEKVDRLIASFGMVSSLPLVVFLIDFGGLLPLCHSTVSKSLYVASNNMSLLGVQPANLLPPAFMKIFLGITIASLVAPMLSIIYFLRREPLRLMGVLSASVTMNLGLVFEKAWDILSILVGVRNSFPVTGEVTDVAMAVHPVANMLKPLIVNLTALAWLLAATDGFVSLSLSPLLSAMAICIALRVAVFSRRGTQLVLAIPGFLLAIAVGVSTVVALGLLSAMFGGVAWAY